jgi:hypothetical protein
MAECTRDRTGIEAAILALRKHQILALSGHEHVGATVTSKVGSLCTITTNAASVKPTVMPVTWEAMQDNRNSIEPERSHRIALP